MRSTLSLLICVLAVASVSSQTNSTNYSIIARGIVEGIVSTQGWSDINNCMTGYDSLTKNLADAINYYYSDNSSSVVTAIKFGKALQQIPSAYRFCNSGVQISRNTMNRLSSFASISDFLKVVMANLRTYSIDLVKETYQGYQYYNQTLLREFGNKLGQGMAQVFLNGTGKSFPGPDANTTSVYMRVAQGFFEGFTTGLRWSEIKACLTDKTNVQNDMNNAIQYLQYADPQTFAQGIGYLGSALVDVPAAIQDCTGAKDKAMALYSALAALQNFEAYSRIVQSNAVVSLFDIYDAVTTAGLDLQVGNYIEFGRNTGSAVSKLFFANVAPNMRK